MSESNIKSYPPIFRPLNIDQTSTFELPDTGVETGVPTLEPPFLTLPLIDMEYLDLEKLDKACREYGIFRVENHGVPTSLLTQLQEHAKRLFQLPFETKQELGKNGYPMKYFWGTAALTSSGGALRKSDALKMDWLEGLNVSFSPLPYHQANILHHLPLVNDFRSLLTDYISHLTRIALALFEVMIKNLNLDLQAFRACLDESTGFIRVYRYPQHCITEDVKGLQEHTDSSVLSILSEDQVGGLQIFKHDMWFKVKPITNTLVVNIGDMMQVLSDDKYKSVKHKVELNKSKERLSICYFVFPEENTLLQSSNYKPFSYNDFRAQVQLEIKTLGHKTGIKSFKL